MLDKVSFVEVKNNVVTLKVLEEGQVIEKEFSAQDLQKLGVHKVLLKDFYKSRKSSRQIVDPYEDIKMRDFQDSLFKKGDLVEIELAGEVWYGVIMSPTSVSMHMVGEVYEVLIGNEVRQIVREKLKKATNRREEK